MTDINARDTKLIQYLNEAYGKEKQLEMALQAHIALTTRKPYKKRLQRHLKETKAHGRAVKSRIKALGGTAEEGPLPVAGRAAEAVSVVQSVANRAAALAQGPLHAVRGTGAQEKLLKNAKTEYQDEAEEIATYTAIETLAESVGDGETAKLARGIRREEERMSTYLERLIPTLTKAVATDEIPAPLRRAGGRSRSRKKRSGGRRRGAGGGSRSGTRSRSGSGSRSSSESPSGSHSRR